MKEWMTVVRFFVLCLMLAVIMYGQQAIFKGLLALSNNQRDIMENQAELPKCITQGECTLNVLIEEDD